METYNKECKAYESCGYKNNNKIEKCKNYKKTKQFYNGPICSNIRNDNNKLILNIVIVICICIIFLILATFALIKKII